MCCYRMKLLGFIIFLFLALGINVPRVFGHMCHDPFRPRDHLVLVPDKDLIRIEKTGEFRMYIENTFSSILRQVELFVEGQAFNIDIEPLVLERLLPGERTFFWLSWSFEVVLSQGWGKKQRYTQSFGR